MSTRLFPLPIQQLTCFVGRKRSRIDRRCWAEAQAVRSLTILSGLVLNWEATGRPHVPDGKHYRANETQQRAVIRLRDAAASMVRAARGTELRQLGIGHRIADGWKTLDGLVNSVRRLQVDVPYGRVSTVLGDVGEGGYGGSEGVDVSRIALPTDTPHFDLTPFLVDDDVRGGYLDPTSLEEPGAPPQNASEEELHAWPRG